VLSCRRLHGRARWLLGLTEPRTRLPGTCGHCTAAALTRTDGTDTIGCEHCGTVITGDDYAAYVGMTLNNLHHPNG
jgi:ribosomal protein L37AE/L43A